MVLGDVEVYDDGCDGGEVESCEKSLFYFCVFEFLGFVK